VARQAGIIKTVTPHTLQHAFITAALDAGIPLRDVQEAASHADPRTTMRYDIGLHFDGGPAVVWRRPAAHVSAYVLDGIEPVPRSRSHAPAHGKVARGLRIPARDRSVAARIPAALLPGLLLALTPGIVKPMTDGQPDQPVQRVQRAQADERQHQNHRKRPDSTPPIWRRR
jgi:Phage integrase family